MKRLNKSSILNTFLLSGVMFSITVFTGCSEEFEPIELDNSEAVESTLIDTATYHPDTSLEVVHRDIDNAGNYTKNTHLGFSISYEEPL